MLHSVWLVCCVALVILILLRTPSQDAGGIQSITTTGGASTSSQPVDGLIWALIVAYLGLSSIAFR